MAPNTHEYVFYLLLLDASVPSAIGGLQYVMATMMPLIMYHLMTLLKMISHCGLLNIYFIIIKLIMLNKTSHWWND